MIRYTLRCNEGHRFEAWFASSGDFDRLKAQGHVTCALCGGAEVEKDLMAPSVATAEIGAENARGGRASGRDAPAEAAPAAPVPDTSAPDLSAPRTPAERALRGLRRLIETHAENVGHGFATEARRIHQGEAPDRPIWGEVRPGEARALLEEGIPVAPLPFAARKTN